MKILIWVLNFTQFILVYFFVFSLLHLGIIGGPGPGGLSLEGLWPGLSILVAISPWKYYNKFSLFIMSKRTKVNSEEASNNKENKELSPNKTKSTRVLNPFFFGYFSLKWRRLIRTLSMILIIIINLLAAYEGIYRDVDDSFLAFVLIFIFLWVLPFTGLQVISWVVKPFVVKED